MFRARRILHRAIAVVIHEQQSHRHRLDPTSSSPAEAREAASTRGRLLQALGLLELTHGNEMFGSALLEICVHEQRNLRPVLLWQRVQDARKRQLMAAGVSRVNKMRANVGRLYCVRDDGGAAGGVGAGRGAHRRR